MLHHPSFFPVLPHDLPIFPYFHALSFPDCAAFYFALVRPKLCSAPALPAFAVYCVPDSPDCLAFFLMACRDHSASSQKPALCWTVTESKPYSSRTRRGIAKNGKSDCKTCLQAA